MSTSDAQETPGDGPRWRGGPFPMAGELMSTQDVAQFLELPHGRLRRVARGAGGVERYRSFDIPKRSGGLRRIDAPIGLLREAQDRLKPYLDARRRPHPASHGFRAGRSVLTNAQPHVGQRLVLNVDLLDFFPTINFGRVRGLFMAEPFGMGPDAATLCAQICIHRNGLPQGAPTSPALSDMIASALDRRLSRLARTNALRYSRYADDITFSTTRAEFPAGVVQWSGAPSNAAAQVGDALEAAISASGFEPNPKKIRVQHRRVRQSVTGLVVNERANVTRGRIRKLRAMAHAWRKFGLEAAAAEHFRRYSTRRPSAPDRAFRNAVYGELAYLRMIRGADDPMYLKACGWILELDPNPSKSLRRMVFGAADFDVFISHAGEDKADVARPIFDACERAGLRAFLDAEHIIWGERFTDKINLALGAAPIVVAVVSDAALSKDWPKAEITTALELELRGEKEVLPVIVGRPNLAAIPMLQAKNHLLWEGAPEPVIAKLKERLNEREKQHAHEQRAERILRSTDKRKRLDEKQPRDRSVMKTHSTKILKLKDSSKGQAMESTERIDRFRKSLEAFETKRTAALTETHAAKKKPSLFAWFFRRR